MAAGTGGSWVSEPPVIIRGSGYLWTPPVLAPNYKNNVIFFNNLLIIYRKLYVCR